MHDEWNFVVGPGASLFDRLSEMPVKLGDVASIFVGLQTSADGIYVLEECAAPTDESVAVKDRNGLVWSLERDALKPFLSKVTVSTYQRPLPHHWLIFPYRLADSEAILVPPSDMRGYFPKAWAYLNAKAAVLRRREGGKWDHDQWYAFGRTQNLAQMDEPKLIVQVISLVGRYAYDDQGVYFTGGGNGPYYGLRWLQDHAHYSLHYLQALLASPLLDFFLRQVSSPFRGGYWSYGKRFIEKLPIHTVNFDDPADVARHDKIVALVQRMLDLHKKLATATIPADKKLYERQIEITDRQIDALVYELYGLTEEEIAIVEAATA